MKDTALITGASGGIGAEFAKLLAAQGYNLVLVARSEEKMRQLATNLQSSYGTQVRVLAYDLADPAVPHKIFATLEESGTHIDLLVNNAGFGVHGEFAQADLKEALEMAQVNMLSLVSLTRLFLPGMVARRRGWILNVGSTGSFAPVPLMALYGASKAFVLSFSEALNEELKGQNVKVSALCPGATLTGFQERAAATHLRIMRDGATMSAERVAQIGYAGLMRGRAVIVPGAFNRWMTWMIRFSPRSLVRRLSHQMMQSV